MVSADMSKKLERISSTLGSLLRVRGLSSRLKEYRIFSQWDEIVGETIALHAQPLSVRRGKLTVLVDSSTWHHHLSQLRPELLEKINRSMGKEGIDGIVFKIGGLEPRHVAGRADTATPAILTSEESRRIEEYVRSLKDEDLRQAAVRLIGKDMLSKRTRR